VSRRFAGAGLVRREARSSVSAGASYVYSVPDSLDAYVQEWWTFRAEDITEVGGKIDVATARKGSNHLIDPGDTADERPTHNPTGQGVGGATFDGVDNCLRSTTAFVIGAGERWSMIVVGKFTDVTTAAHQTLGIIEGGAAATHQVQLRTTPVTRLYANQVAGDVTIDLTPHADPTIYGLYTRSTDSVGARDAIEYGSGYNGLIGATGSKYLYLGRRAVSLSQPCDCEIYYAAVLKGDVPEAAIAENNAAIDQWLGLGLVY